MRVSRREAAANRDRVLETAGALFRARGLEGVTIAEVMSGAGLTHGGFYGQFASKDAFIVEACARGVSESVAAIHESATGPGDPSTRLERVLGHYLSRERRDDPAQACTVSGLAADAGRGPRELQDVFAAGVTAMAQVLESVGRDPVADDDAGPPDYPLLAAMVGAMVLSRAVRDADLELSDRILHETTNRLSGSTPSAGTPLTRS